MIPFLLYVALVASPLDVQTRTMARAGAHDALKLPFVTGAGAVSERINTVVYLTLLAVAPPTAEGALAESDDSKWYTSLAFTILRNDDRLLELAFTGEACSSYCEPITRSFSFDVRTGRSVDLPDVLAARGLDFMGKRMRAERMRRYSGQIQQLSRVRNSTKDLRDRLTFAGECLKYEQTHELHADALAATFTSKGITVTSERCSSHAMRALDDVGDVSMTVAYGDVAATMTPYGKSLLMGSADAAPPDDAFGQALRGTLGPAAVTVVLQRPNSDGLFSGHYFYDKERKPIALRGHRGADGTIQITESAAARFEVTPGGGGLSGKWLGNGRTLDVHWSP